MQASITLLLTVIGLLPCAFCLLIKASYRLLLLLKLTNMFDFRIFYITHTFIADSDTTQFKLISKFYNVINFLR